MSNGQKKTLLACIDKVAVAAVFLRGVERGAAAGITAGEVKQLADGLVEAAESLYQLVYGENGVNDDGY
jgi:hypothetical protein